jgi:phage FluMu protein Com
MELRLKCCNKKAAEGDFEGRIEIYCKACKKYTTFIKENQMTAELQSFIKEKDEKTVNLSGDINQP